MGELSKRKLKHILHTYHICILRWVISIEYESRQPQLFLVFDLVKRILIWVSIWCIYKYLCLYSLWFEIYLTSLFQHQMPLWSFYFLSLGSLETEKISEQVKLEGMLVLTLAANMGLYITCAKTCTTVWVLESAWLVGVKYQIVMLLGVMPPFQSIITHIQCYSIYLWPVIMGNLFLAVLPFWDKLRLEPDQAQPGLCSGLGLSFVKPKPGPAHHYTHLAGHIHRGVEAIGGVYDNSIKTCGGL